MTEGVPSTSPATDASWQPDRSIDDTSRKHGRAVRALSQRVFCLQPAAVSADPEFNRIADDTFRSTEQRLCRTPIHTKEDAFAALKFIEHELADDGTAWDFLKPVFKSLRAYIEGGRP